MGVRKIAILGSTGSIGTQALDVIRANPDKLEVEVLTANTSADLLISQALEFNPAHVVIADEQQYEKVKDALRQSDTKVYTGYASIADVLDITSADTVLTAMVGYSGLLPTIRAIKNKKRIALANKETLVVAGQLISELCAEYQVDLIPVDSEHSAIFQCLVGESFNEIDKIILTASGGPFRGKKQADLSQITRAEALKHPNWTMGAKITIDSATLMNKGLEVIEAKWLFGVRPDQIEVVVHPQSIIHSMVEFNDGSIKAQLGLPDMKLPIHYAFFYPARVKASMERMSFSKINRLDFEVPDQETFINLALAYEALNRGGNAPCIINGSNEMAVAAFLRDEIGFLDIGRINERTLEASTFIPKPGLDDYIQSDAEARARASEFINAIH